MLRRREDKHGWTGWGLFFLGKRSSVRRMGQIYRTIVDLKERCAPSNLSCASMFVPLARARSDISKIDRSGLVKMKAMSPLRSSIAPQELAQSCQLLKCESAIHRFLYLLNRGPGNVMTLSRQHQSGLHLLQDDVPARGLHGNLWPAAINGAFDGSLAKLARNLKRKITNYPPARGFGVKHCLEIRVHH
jgi:hypothetical protein